MLGGDLLLLGEVDGALSLEVVLILVDALLILSSGLLHSYGLSDLRVADVTLSLDSEGSDQSLDLGSLLGLSSLSSDNELSDVVVLGQVEEFSDLVGSLGSESARLDLVGETGDVLSSLLNNNKVENRKIGTNDATTDGLSLAGTLSSGSEALHVLVEEKSDTSVGKNTLHHGETLLVVTTSNADDIAGPLLTEGVSWDLSGNS